MPLSWGAGHGGQKSFAYRVGRHSILGTKTFEKKGMLAKSGEVSVWLSCANSNFLVLVIYTNHTLYHHRGTRDDGGTGHLCAIFTALVSLQF